jgi:uncharacterized protein
MSHPDDAVAFVVHDVAPSTWPECAAWLRLLDFLGAGPVTLLVVPHYHYQNPITNDARFVAALDRRLARGDELALHGYHHHDEESPPRTLRDFVERRLLTRAEGEFAALNEPAAAWRIARGIETFRMLNWPLYGFVPPAWLLSAASRQAIEHCGYPFRYVSARAGLYRLPQWRFVRTANLCYSPDAAWRRLLSRALIRTELFRAQHRSLLRVSLHPQDIRYPDVVAHWRALITRALSQRIPVTKERWLASLEPEAVVTTPATRAPEETAPHGAG